MSSKFDSNAATLSRFVMSQTNDHDLVILLNALAISCKLITSAVQRAGVAKLYGLAGEVNSTGDDQKKLDVLSNDMMINALIHSGVCSVLVSEENEEPIIVPPAYSGKFCVAFDPLDGSSNIDCNVSVGTIFSVYERKPGSHGSVDDLLRSGAHCICAGYVVYSSAVELVFTFRGGDVHGFCLDSTIGEFVHTREKMMFPADGGKRIYSCNEGNAVHWDDPIQEAVEHFKTAEQPYTARYVGSMVADIHRTILYGGIYLYPADAKAKKGKLRLLYEGIPMAMIIEQAGGIASTGMFEGKIQRVLDLTPNEIHAKCPIIMGGKRDVQVVYDQYAKHGVNVPSL
ncbi:fructose-1,6-bisphosphatase I [Fistulifera solaris]|uniref:Fructose-1,6-bisphosphatase, cytosolic n=1 Tax=Fistulifera solaris TaxID=1519565 RepID=A0A1Z5KI08_FISSO|nr:fructose-1,6-bisphosphatase I [Fistulifera solaris]|eukprot:GAX25944.1 fructose-1,6-bisphosphatase I [Fistulifera solaris]